MKTKFGNSAIITYYSDDSYLYQIHEPTTTGWYYVRAVVNPTPNYEGTQDQKQVYLQFQDGTTTTPNDGSQPVNNDSSGLSKTVIILIAAGAGVLLLGIIAGVISIHKKRIRSSY